MALSLAQEVDSLSSAVRRPYHVVQISLDDAIFSAAEDSEPLMRQVSYGRVLASRAADSRLSLIVLTRRSDAQRVEIDNVTAIPLSVSIATRFRLFAQLRKLHMEQPIDVIATQTLSLETAIALLFARWYGCRVVGQIHYDIFSPFAAQQLRGGWLQFLIFRRFFRYLFAVRAVGHRIAKNLLDRGIHWNVHVIPVPAPMLRDAARRDERSAGRRVLFVGRLVPEKGLKDWLRIAAEVVREEPEVEFEIVGDGPLRSELEEMVEALGLGERVRFAGRVPNDRLGERYRDARLLLLTSHYEGFGRVAVEAYANEVPVIAPRITGLEDIIEHERSGFLHEPGDVIGMAQSVVRLLRDAERAREMGRVGRAKVLADFHPDRLAERWMDLLISAALPRLNQLVLPRARTFSRWREVAWSRFTLLRSLEYEAIRGLELKGRTLDIGGGTRTSYQALLKIDGTLESVNIDPKIKPTVVIDINAGLPFTSESFDNVISFNTLEHIRDDEHAVSEIIRVLRPGGAFHLIVPFLYQIHGSPSDFHRHTIFWWIHYLESVGIRNDSFVLEPLVWDRFSSAYSLVGHGPIGLRLKRLVTLPAVIGDFVRGRRGRLPDTPRTRSVLDLTLGYYIRGVK